MIGINSTFLTSHTTSSPCLNSTSLNSTCPIQRTAETIQNTFFFEMLKIKTQIIKKKIGKKKKTDFKL